MVEATVERLVRVVTALKGELMFRSLDGGDALSQLGEVRVSVLSTRGDIDAADLLGTSVSVVMTTPHQTKREFNGLATAFHQTGQEGRYHQYRIVVRPWTWVLTRTSDCRIFQDKTVREIIEQVFNEYPFADFEFQLAATYRKWVYCVQYRETDFNFVSRLMEQEGMHYFFRHQGGKHTLVIADGPMAHVPVANYETIAYHDPEDAAARHAEGIRFWSHGCEIGPTSYVTRDFNFTKPRADMEAKADPARPARLQNVPPLEIFDYPGEYPERSDGQQYARVRIEEMRHQSEHFEAESNAHGLVSGSVFALSGYPRKDQNQQYLVVSADYRVHESPYESSDDTGGEVFAVNLRAIPATQPFQPPRLTPKPMVQGPQTAIVVGGSGDEIHTDEYGRVKVQFHWDREGKSDENSSCWIRVAHPWAGQNWGMVAIPRVGQEVIVDFLEGDPDQPIITGRVYNAEQMPPYNLPGNMTQTGIKSRSSKGGGVANCNEIRFEDKTGSEHLLIHAEKDQMIEVENDETHTVGHDRAKTVEHDETTDIGHDRSEAVGNDESIDVRGNRDRTVGKNETVNIADDLEETIGKNVTVTIGENQTLTVGTDAKSQVGKKYYLEAGDEITLKTGSASIVLKKDGSIAIKGSDITIQGSGKIGVKASGDVVVKGAKITNN